MKLKYSDDGLVDGGVECAFIRNGEYEIETVFDLTDWIKRQFLELQKEAEIKNEQGGKYLAFHHLWIGGGEMPFAFIEASRSRYKAFCVHPELRDSSDWSIETSNVETASAFLANKAMRVPDLNWQTDGN